MAHDVYHRSFGPLAITENHQPEQPAVAEGVESILSWRLQQGAVETVRFSLSAKQPVHLAISNEFLQELNNLGWGESWLAQQLPPFWAQRKSAATYFHGGPRQKTMKRNLLSADRSLSLWETRGDSFFVNQSLLQYKRVASTAEEHRIADFLFLLGLSHELVHTSDEEDPGLEPALIEEDLRFIDEALRSKRFRDTAFFSVLKKEVSVGAARRVNQGLAIIRAQRSLEALALQAEVNKAEKALLAAGSRRGRNKNLLERAARSVRKSHANLQKYLKENSVDRWIKTTSSEWLLLHRGRDDRQLAVAEVIKAVSLRAGPILPQDRRDLLDGQKYPWHFIRKALQQLPGLDSWVAFKNAMGLPMPQIDRPRLSDLVTLQQWTLHPAWESLRGRLMRYAKKKGIRDAEDAVQHALLKLWKMDATPFSESGAWLDVYANEIIKNNAIDISRREKRLSPLPDHPESLSDLLRWNQSPEIEARLMFEQIGAKLKAAIRGLPERRREVLMLRFRGLTAREMVEVLRKQEPKINEGAVKARLHNALNDLKKTGNYGLLQYLPPKRISKPKPSNILQDIHTRIEPGDVFWDILWVISHPWVAPFTETWLFPYAVAAGPTSPESLIWATAGFALAHLIVRWVVRLVAIFDSRMSPRHELFTTRVWEDLRDGVIWLLLSLVFLAPFAVVPPWIGYWISAAIHLAFNLLVEFKILPAWMKPASVISPVSFPWRNAPALPAPAPLRRAA